MSNDLFAAALGVASPWYVRNVEFDAGKRLLTISIDFAKGSRFPYEGVKGLHPVHDTQTKRYWHLNFFQHECYLDSSGRRGSSFPTGGWCSLSPIGQGSSPASRCYLRRSFWPGANVYRSR